MNWFLQKNLGIAICLFVSVMGMFTLAETDMLRLLDSEIRDHSSVGMGVVDVYLQEMTKESAVITDMDSSRFNLVKAAFPRAIFHTDTAHDEHSYSHAFYKTAGKFRRLDIKSTILLKLRT